MLPPPRPGDYHSILIIPGQHHIWSDGTVMTSKNPVVKYPINGINIAGPGVFDVVI